MAEGMFLVCMGHCLTNIIYLIDSLNLFQPLLLTNQLMVMGLLAEVNTENLRGVELREEVEGMIAARWCAALPFRTGTAWYGVDPGILQGGLDNLKCLWQLPFQLGSSACPAWQGFKRIQQHCWKYAQCGRDDPVVTSMSKKYPNFNSLVCSASFLIPHAMMWTMQTNPDSIDTVSQPGWPT